MQFDKNHGGSEDFDEEESEPGWLASFSDMMTDLLAIFVILFAFAMMEISNARSYSESVALFEGGTGGSAVLEEEPSGDGLLPSQKQERLKELIEAIDDYIGKAGLSAELLVIKDGDDKVLLRMADSALFDSGKADITPKADKLLSNISKILVEYSDFIKIVRIEGHTDNRPINTPQFRSNWELSASRSINVLKRLLEISQLEPQKFYAVGFSEFSPIADNNTVSGRAQNRRVDFVIETKVND